MVGESQIKMVELEFLPEEVKETIVNRYKVDGAILNFEIHPSNEYLLVLSHRFLYVFKVGNSEICGKIPIKEACQDLVIDKSGLFCALTAQQSRRVYLYEVGTSRLVYEFCLPFTSIRSVQFSACCRYLVMADGHSSSVQLYSLDRRFSDQMRKVADLMRGDEQLWKKFPIVLASE